jgi:hypothetical protein
MRAKRASFPGVYSQTLGARLRRGIRSAVVHRRFHSLRARHVKRGFEQHAVERAGCAERLSAAGCQLIANKTLAVQVHEMIPLILPP